MAKRKRKKSNKKGFLSGIFSVLGGTFRLSLKLFPFVLIVGSLGVLFFGVRSALYADSNLTIQKIVVEPADAVSIQTRSALESNWLGKNILKIDLDNIARNLEKSPEIRLARVTRHLPAALKIEVEKRKPVAFVRISPKGAIGSMSEDGMILDVVKQTNGSMVLVEAFGVGAQEPQVGRTIHLKGFSQALTFLRKFWEDPLARRETITKISLDRLGNTTVTLANGPDIRLGRYPEERLAVLEKAAPILEDADRSKIEYIDLQFDNVIVKRKTGK